MSVGEETGFSVRGGTGLSVGTETGLSVGGGTGLSVGGETGGGTISGVIMMGTGTGGGIQGWGSLTRGCFFADLFAPFPLGSWDPLDPLDFSDLAAFGPADFVLCSLVPFDTPVLASFPLLFFMDFTSLLSPPSGGYPP